jgi:hypothetical protein
MKLVLATTFGHSSGEDYLKQLIQLQKLWDLIPGKNDIITSNPVQ